MPMSDWALGKDAWDLVQYVLSLSTPAQREAATVWTPSELVELPLGDLDMARVC